MQKNKIKNYQTLGDLFKDWQEYQKNQPENTNVFISDGYINKSAYDNSTLKILFILKESHYFTNNENSKLETFKEDSQVDFYRDFLKKDEMVYQFKKDKSGEYLIDENEEEFEKIKMCTEINSRVIPNAWYPNEKFPKKCRRFDNRPRQKEKIARMAEYILHGNITSNYEKLKNALEQVAFMNINKMGGGDTTNPDKLLKYYESNEKFIKSQISILKPDVLVLMINNEKIEDDLEQYWNDHVKNINKDKKVFIRKMTHTAARSRNLELETKEIEYFNKNIAEKYQIKDINEVLNNNYQEDEMNLFNKESESPYLRFNKSTLKYLIKFIYNYENSEEASNQ